MGKGSTGGIGVSDNRASAQSEDTEAGIHPAHGREEIKSPPGVRGRAAYEGRESNAKLSGTV